MISASNASSFVNHLSGPAARQNASTSAAVAIVSDDAHRILTAAPRRRDALVERRVEPHEGLRGGIVEIDRIADGVRIEALLHQIDLLLLEGRGHVDVLAEAQEHRPRIVRQPLGEVVAERRQVEVVGDDDRRHAGAAVAARHVDAVDIGVLHAVEGADRFRDLGGRDVLALPAEGVADAVDEIEIAVRVLAHQVAGAEPDVAFLEHVAQDLLLGLRLGRIALEAGRRLRGVARGSCRSPRRARRDRIRCRSRRRCAPAAACSTSKRTTLIGKRCARNQGMRPTAPSLPSKLNIVTLPSVAA